MAARALGAMFGGLEEFLKLRRGLRQDTENREFLEKAREQQLTRGGLENVGLTNQNVITGAQAGVAPQMATLGVAGRVKDLGGPQALDQAAIGELFKDSPTLASGLVKGMGAQSAREQVGDDIQKSQATLQGNQASRSTTALGAFNEIAAAPEKFDFVNDQNALTKGSIAGLEGVGRPAAAIVNKWDAEAQGRQFANTRALQDDSQQFVINRAQAVIPPGVDESTHSMLEDSINQFRERTAALQAQINRIDVEVAEGQANMRRAQQQFGQKAAFNAASQESPYLRALIKEQAAKRAEIRLQGEQILKMVDGFGIQDPRSIAYYKGRVNSTMMGTQPPPNTTDTSTTTPPGGVEVFK